MNNIIKAKTECYRKAVEKVIANHDGVIRDMLLTSIKQAFDERLGSI